MDNSLFDLIVDVEVVQLVSVLCGGYNNYGGCAGGVELCRQYQIGG